MNPALQLLKWELRQIAFDRQFLIKIAIGMGISLLLLPFLLNSLSSFTQDVTAPNLPFVFKIVTVGVVGENVQIEQKLRENTLISAHKLSKSDAELMLQKGELNGIVYLGSKSAEFVGANNALSSLAELQVRDAVDKAIRTDRGEAVKALQKESIEPFVRGIIAPFIIFSPLLLWCLPIIQSISYDRENKMLEALFSLPVNRPWIYLMKVLANFIFAIAAGAIWLSILGLAGIAFVEPLGVFLILSLISLLIISLNGLVSTISSNVKNATLAAGITSTVVFSFLFILSLLRINPYLESFASISPVTYISYHVAGVAAPFPFATILIMLIIIATAVILSVAAFSTEKFAFSLNPGIPQLFEGMLEILGRKEYASLAMGFVAFALTFPVQVLALGVILFVSASLWVVILLLAAAEEALKFIALRIIKPTDYRNGAAYGALVGLAYGVCESILFAPFLPQLQLRLIPVIAHMVFTAVAGIGMGMRKQYLGLFAAVLLHFAYNYLIVSSGVFR